MLSTAMLMVLGGPLLHHGNWTDIFKVKAQRGIEQFE